MADETTEQGRDVEPMTFVNARTPQRVKDAANALAGRRGLKLSGLVTTLLVREIEADRAATLADVVTPPNGTRVLGQARNVTARILSGSCLHPIHMREPHKLGERCGGCGETFARRR